MVDPLSLTSILLEPSFNETKLGFATGFIIKKHTQHYLATNWHVVSGRNPLTNECLHSSCALPNTLIIWHHVQSQKTNTIEWVPIRVPLYKSSDVKEKEKKWIEHPNGKKIDVVLLPLEPLSQIQMYAFDMKLKSIDMIPTPAMPVSIIGFPEGKTAGGALPIWVTGFIASEPNINIDDNPLFYANATGYKGLSGAPVVLRLAGGYATNDGNFVVGGRYQTKFIGVYSGRVYDNFDLCHVWKPAVLDQILELV